ncbi:MAG: exodeoxyribonuclease VII large subunit [Clostridia bacterium]|nr:exodeoxyribonuclease VII large subunit [Clostridia bacterium]
MNELVLSVTQLNTYARNLLEQDPHLANVFVVGEISNFTNHYRSGHWYLSLKDENALIGAVMFRSAVQRMRFVPQDGMRVICRGRVTLYDRDGRYQLYIEDMQPDGMGALSLAFEQLKDKLEKIGLFDHEHKKTLPAFPETIALVTSPTGAAVQDMLNILTRRYPVAKVLMCPVQVQGETAAGQLTDMINTLSFRDDIDVIIIGRGGGSMEDLWAFNSEELAFAIYNCPIPVISAVGHETDFTISDFVADLRAPTPSAAAELAVPQLTDLLASVAYYKEQMTTRMVSRIETEERVLNRLASCRKLTTPHTIIEPYIQRLDRAEQRFSSLVREQLTERENQCCTLSARLQAYSPLGVLKRGYTLTKKDGAVIRSAEQLTIGDRIQLILGEGSATCVVEQKEEV